MILILVVNYRGKDEKIYILGEGILFSRVGPRGTNLAATPDLPAPKAMTKRVGLGQDKKNLSYNNNRILSYLII